jgi:hypothetical protein
MRRLAYLCFAITAVTAVDAATASADEVVVAPTAVAVQPRVYHRRPGPRVMLPLTMDLGYVGTDSMLGYADGISGSLGVHWSSLSPHPIDTDVGVGVFGALLAAQEPAGMTGASTGIEYGGAYLQVGHTLSQNRFARTWASARGEYLESTAFGGPNHVGFGGSVRLTAELYASGEGIAPGQLFLGTYAVGLYAEAGERSMIDGVSDFQATFGMTIRTPMVLSIF